MTWNNDVESALELFRNASLRDHFSNHRMPAVSMKALLRITAKDSMHCESAQSWCVPWVTCCVPMRTSRNSGLLFFSPRCNRVA
jgi:hypothetical protein